MRLGEGFVPKVLAHCTLGDEPPLTIDSPTPLLAKLPANHCWAREVTSKLLYLYALALEMEETTVYRLLPKLLQVAVVGLHDPRAE